MTFHFSNPRFNPSDCELDEEYSNIIKYVPSKQFFIYENLKFLKPNSNIDQAYSLINNNNNKLK